MGQKYFKIIAMVIPGILFVGCSRSASREESTLAEKWHESPYAASLEIGEVNRQNFSYSCENFYSLLKPPSECVYAGKTEETVLWDKENFTLFTKVCGHDSSFHPIVATVTKSQADVDLTVLLLEEIEKADLAYPIKELFTEEVLAKILAYRKCRRGQEFVITSPQGPIRYKVDAIFNMGGGVPAYGCIPVGEIGSPIIIFRGSEFSLNRRGRATLAANIDRKGPGYFMYKRVQPRLRYWLDKQTRVYGKAKVLGFSLGGALAAYAVTLDYDLFEKGTSFNMPGLRKKIAHRFSLIKEEDRPLFISYVNRGDAVSKIGKLLGKVQEFSFPETLKLVRAHNLLILGEPKVFVREVNLEEENSSSRILSTL